MALKTWMGSAGGPGPGASPVGNPQGASPNQVQGPGGWHPTILYLLLLIVAEVVVIGWLLRLTGGR
jgi:hypothetical protein